MIATIGKIGEGGGWTCLGCFVKSLYGRVILVSFVGVGDSLLLLVVPLLLWLLLIGTLFLLWMSTLFGLEISTTFTILGALF